MPPPQSTPPGGVAATPSQSKGVALEDLTWLEAEALLTPAAVVVIPLGAAAKEHGPHLRLDNDLQLARYFTARVLAAAEVIVAPCIPYHYYPAFVDYPGSTHLAFDTARELVADIVRSLARHGPRRFYVLNTGISTRGPLAAAAESMGREGILLRYTDLRLAGNRAKQRVQQQSRGSHADEIETSMMLAIAPERVDMRLAVRDEAPEAAGPFTRQPDGRGLYSASGVWGDPTLASAEKGRVVVEAVLEDILRDIDTLRSAALPPTA